MTAAAVRREQYQMGVLERQIFEHRMRDTFAGYDWGDPIILWTIRPDRTQFSLEQLEVAQRVLERAS